MNYSYFPIIISAPSGGGKSSVKNFLLKKDNRFAFSITCTTREKRKNEINGKDYFFITSKEFERLKKKRILIEWAKVHEHYYGTPKSSVFKILKEGKIPLMTIDVKGAESVKKIFKDSISIFILPLNLKTMLERLKKRKEKNEEIKTRMQTAKKEILKAFNFDYIVLNDKLDKAAEDIIKIVETERLKTYKNLNFLKKFKKELSNFKV